MKITISDFPDAKTEEDFYKSYLRKNPTGFAQFLDGDIEQVQASTSEDEKAFALAVITRQLTEEYNASVKQQAANALQRQLDAIAPALPIPPLTKTGK